MITSLNIRKVIKETVMGFEIEALDEDEDFTDAGIDSLDHAVILLALDEEFGIKIADSDVDKCNSIDNILCYIKEI